jgi:hypothetical protein
MSRMFLLLFSCCALLSSCASVLSDVSGATTYGSNRLQVTYFSPPVHGAIPCDENNVPDIDGHSWCRLARIVDTSAAPAQQATPPKVRHTAKASPTTTHVSFVAAAVVPASVVDPPPDDTPHIIQTANAAEVVSEDATRNDVRNNDDEREGFSYLLWGARICTIAALLLAALYFFTLSRTQRSGVQNYSP